MAEIPRPEVVVPTGAAWDELRDRLQTEYRSEVFFVAIDVDVSGTATIEGNVASEKFSTLLTDLVFAQPTVMSVANNVIVTSPLHPAQSIDPTDWLPPRAVDQDESVTRYPSITSVGRPQPGALFEVNVDLTLDPDNSVDPEAMRISDLPADWNMLTIDARILSSELVFETGADTGTVTIRRDQPSQPAAFVGRVSELANAGSDVRVTVLFSYKGRFAGSAKASFELVGEKLATKQQSPPATLATTTSFLAVPSAVGADLTVHVLNVDDSDKSNWVFNCLAAPDLADRKGVSVLGRGRKEYLTDLFQSVQFYDPATHRRRLQGIGERVWSVAPVEFQSLYASLRTRLGTNFSIQFITDDPFVPWEMMFPTDMEGADHLFMSHPVSRWVLDVPYRTSVFPAGAIASFVPNYGSGTLPAAVEEGRYIVDVLGGIAKSSVRSDFVSFLEQPGSPPTQIVHFAGHGASSRAGERGIEMEDGSVVLEDLTSSVVLGKDHRSLFVLNACEMGSSDVALGVVESWPERLLSLRFGGVIAPLWAIRDAHASAVIRDTLHAFRQSDVTLSEALRASRAKHRDASATPYAYLCYGDVMAKASR